MYQLECYYLILLKQNDYMTSQKLMKNSCSPEGSPNAALYESLGEVKPSRDKPSVPYLQNF